MDSKASAPVSRLVGLAGSAGTGKTTIGEEFENEQAFKLLSYAYPLKQALIKMTGLAPKWFYDIDYKEREIPGLGVTPRIMMQKFGTVRLSQNGKT